jgi:hypothetical protein
MQAAGQGSAWQPDMKQMVDFEQLTAIKMYRHASPWSIGSTLEMVNTRLRSGLPCTFGHCRVKKTEHFGKFPYGAEWHLTRG